MSGLISAILKGKLSRRHESMEDILTSCVFDVLQNHPESGLLPFVRHARSLEGKYPLEAIPERSPTICEFWPWINSCEEKGCQPDILLSVAPESEHSKVAWSIMIEAKLGSPPESEQLIREWRNHVHYLVSGERYLILLTADFVMPKKAYMRVKDSLDQHEYEKFISDVLWLSWRHLELILNETLKSNPCKDLELLLKLLVRLHLTGFHGFSTPAFHRILWMWHRSSRKE